MRPTGGIPELIQRRGRSSRVKVEPGRMWSSTREASGRSAASGSVCAPSAPSVPSARSELFVRRGRQLRRWSNQSRSVLDGRLARPWFHALNRIACDRRRPRSSVAGADMPPCRVLLTFDEASEFTTTSSL